MRYDARLRTLERSRTALDIVNRWIQETLEYPCRSAYLDACDRAHPPTTPLRELRTEIARLAASQREPGRAAWVRQTVCDALVLYSIAKTLQQASARHSTPRWHQAAHVRYRLAQILELGRSEFENEERRHQIAVWVPAAREVLTRLALDSEVQGVFQRLYFRGRDIRYDDDKRLDASMAFEAESIARLLDRLAEDATVPDDVKWTAPTSRDISNEVQYVFELAQFRSLRILGEDDRAEQLWRVMHADDQEGA